MPEIYGTNPKAMTCQCCGAPLSRTHGGWRCSYCGTTYADDRGALKIISVPTRTQYFSCDVVVDDWLVERDPDYASKYILQQISKQLADGIAPHMKIETETDPMTMQSRVRASIGIVLPGDGVSSFWTR
jgi:hypothetical protein